MAHLLKHTRFYILDPSLTIYEFPSILQEEVIEEDSMGKCYEREYINFCYILMSMKLC